jgi:hypothetical protein
MVESLLQFCQGMSQGDIVDRVYAQHIALLIYTCFSAYTMQARSTKVAPQQTEKSGAKFQIIKCLKQTLSSFPMQSTLVISDIFRSINSDG